MACNKALFTHMYTKKPVTLAAWHWDVWRWTMVDVEYMVNTCYYKNKKWLMINWWPFKVLPFYPYTWFLFHLSEVGVTPARPQLNVFTAFVAWRHSGDSRLPSAATTRFISNPICVKVTPVVSKMLHTSFKLQVLTFWLITAASLGQSV